MAADRLDGVAHSFKLEQDHKRELDNKHKWAMGEAYVTRGQLNRRPNKIDPGYVRTYTTPTRNELTAMCNRFQRLHRREIEFQQNKAAKVMKISRKNVSGLDDDINTSDSSAEEDVKEASAAPEPDAGITYSFDAPQGPGKGSQILSLAIAKAVEKYEVKVTEKLVKDEYEIVGKEHEVANAGYIADEDDFELL